MRGESLPIVRSWRPTSLQRLRGFLHLAVCFVLITVSILLVGALVHGEKGVSIIWFANAILLSYLLLAPRWLWPRYIVTGFLALVFGSALIHEPWRLNLFYNTLNLIEAVGAALLLRPRSTRLPRFIDPRYLARFVMVAVLLCPISVAALYSVIGMLSFHLSPLDQFIEWATASALGMAAVTPTCVALLQASLRNMKHRRADLLYLLTLGIVTCGAFTSQGALLIFLVYPLLVVATLCTDPGWGAVCAAIVAVLACVFTVGGYGPFVHALMPNVVLQTFIAAAVFMVYAVSAIIEDLNATERRLEQIVALHNLITENSRDLIILSDFDGNRRYISGSAATWTGWSRDELQAHGSMELLHPSDRPEALALVGSLRSGGRGGLVECRMRMKNGEYIWTEANIRPVRDPVTGAITGALNVVRNIAQRKDAEEELHNAYRALEALAVTDSLTQLANRRYFDSYLNNEWRRGLREPGPLSMLLIDVDKFKLYNDTYGHLRGDSCLQHIAEAIQGAVTRPSDKVARFGGEEFAIVLPNTPNDGALAVAEAICTAIRRQAMEHVGNLPGYVTVSIGCATMIPTAGKHPAVLIQKADDALYAAKRTGRNRIGNANEVEEETGVAKAS
ncbi:MAG TPA: diguanylate cyclase [Terracidiphilus sp.]|nr:diguanylate cyclase [Terracidiphilus sp.]